MKNWITLAAVGRANSAVPGSSGSSTGIFPKYLISGRIQRDSGRTTGNEPKIIIVKVVSGELITGKLPYNFGQTLEWTSVVQRTASSSAPSRVGPYGGLSAKEISAAPSARKSRGNQRKASPQLIAALPDIISLPLSSLFFLLNRM